MQLKELNLSYRPQTATGSPELSRTAQRLYANETCNNLHEAAKRAHLERLISLMLEAVCLYSTLRYFQGQEMERHIFYEERLQ